MGGGEQAPRLVPLKDGPYRVEGLKKLINSRQEALPVRSTMLLCRCGGSKNKPFCDGTHTRNAFASRPPSEGVRDRRRDYPGSGITIHDNRCICSHAEHCTRESPAVFHRNRRPWIDPDGEESEKIIKTVEMCPSGALSYSVDGREYRDREAEAEIYVDRNGPYCIRGGVELVGHDLGVGASREHYTLCRCGRSENMPRCDGSHWEAGFEDGDGPDRS